MTWAQRRGLRSGRETRVYDWDRKFPKKPASACWQFLLVDEFELSCRYWFKALGLRVPWVTSRVMATCKILGLTPVQLGALVGLRNYETKQFMKRNSFPVPVCLHFLLLERWYKQVKLGLPNEDHEQATIPVHLIDREREIKRGLKEAKRWEKYRRTKINMPPPKYPKLNRPRCPLTMTS